MINKDLLRRQVLGHGDLFKDLAAALDITHPCLSGKIHGRTEFTCREIRVIMERYALSPEQVALIFFTSSVS